MADMVITNSSLLTSSPPTLDTSLPLTIFDYVGVNNHFMLLHAFHAPTPSNDAFKEALSKALSYFPIFSGRLATSDIGRRYIHLNDAGARLVEAHISTPLAEKLPLETRPDLDGFYPSVGDGVEELLQVQLNRFSCGGLVIGLTGHHRVVDGRSLNNFLTTWAALVRGSRDGVVSSTSFLDRETLFVPRNPPVLDFNHMGAEFEPSEQRYALKHVENVVLHFSPEFITLLKGFVPRKCSTSECVIAHLWKKIITSIPDQLNGDELSEVVVSVDGRRRMRPSVPAEYFGNMVLQAHPMLTVRELLHASLDDIVRVIHDAVSRVDDHYIRSFIDFGKVMEGKEEELMTYGPKLVPHSTCPNIVVSSCLSFEYHELDFGMGKPFACITPHLVLDGLVMLVPSCQEKGGVVAYIALLPDHAKEFKKSCYSINYKSQL